MSQIALILTEKTVNDEIETILKLAGHKVLVADGELSGRNLIAREKPELLIIDNMCGLPIIEEFKKDFPKLAVVSWMKERDAKTAVTLMRSGVLDCLCPPLRAAEVVGVINHSLGQPEGGRKGTRLLLPYINLRKYKKQFQIGFAVTTVLTLAIMWLTRAKVIMSELPHNNPTTLVIEEKKMWVGDWYNQSIYSYRFEDDLEVAGNYYFANFGPLAIARSGDYLWSAGNDLKLRQHILNERLDVVQSFPLKEHAPSGMVIIEGYLWISDSSKKKVFRYLMGRTLSQVNIYDVDLSYPVGLSWDGTHIWLADAKTDKAYKYKRRGKKLDVQKVYQLPAGKKGDLAGIFPTKEWVYAVYSGGPAKLYKYRISHLEEAK